MAQERFKAKKDAAGPDADRETASVLPRKRRKVHEETAEEREQKWETFLKDVEEFEIQHVLGKGKFTFGFVEGPLIKALRSGDWILLDEINLASPETLECISSLLHGPTASITLTEHGELEPVPRHPDFRLFACMNPATDVGKKDLPPNIRSKFTEIDVPPPDADKETLLSIVEKYIGSHAIGDKGAIMNVAEFYLAVKDLAEKRLLADGSNHRPHFSMRTLARALTFAADIASTYSLRRAIWEGCLMAFTMVLDSQSAELVTALAHKHLLVGVRNPRSMLTREPNPPHNAEEYVKLGPFYLAKGPLPADSMEHYIMTPSVEEKLKDLARIILTRRFPVLIEGPTSSGKTSSIEYLAKRTGHEFIRINNHEHTDIQEYIGSYVSDPVTGKLVFKDGLLVQALRKGSWIVLDELNLAPTDVLEALNRLLDDNRELVIPETHEVVRPHPHFMLFATQNPPGLYAGRKILSRAFRNRFLEVHFEDVPQAELEVILCQRCRIAPSYGKKIVEVFRQLQKRRQSSRVFESKQGFVTLRDLFRWAGRDAMGYQELAENGYMLLAERTRREEDKVAVKEVLETVMNVRIDEDTLYDPRRYEADIISFLGCAPPTSTNVIWTKAMQRLFVLFSRALKFKEPVLLVGETGSGKTSVCQVYADAVNRKLHGLSCHQNTETADIIGGLRPLRNRQVLVAETVQEASTLLKELGLLDTDDYEPEHVRRALDKALKSSSNVDPAVLPTLDATRSKLLRAQSIFEWRDGPLIEAMRNGEVFLLDEISLAEDSVLERLNSVLELERTIVLAERGGGGDESPQIEADDGFRLVATMNPGGDYGKKELSPALRNRFTEIWVPQIDDRHDLELIADNLWKSKDLQLFTAPLLDFVEWLCARIGDRSILTLRDILAWITFVNHMHISTESSLTSKEIFHHAAHMTYLDGLSSLSQLSSYSKDALTAIKNESVKKLEALVPLGSANLEENPAASEGRVKLGPFSLKVGDHEPKPHLFTLSAPTTQDNALRLARACQVPKPILLEGSPGVGKTSLVVALANIAGQQLHRINLSDQTDLVDLFGSDLPVEGGRPGEFAWRDGEFLQALQLGHWVLLDEMNLAPQAVLEGLNAVLDHRGSVYIPELGRSFVCHPAFRIFAAQNPLNQGGGRKGLPKSFINRFTKVYIEELTANDYLLVCRHLFPDIDDEVLQAMITFNSELNQEVVVKKTFARDGFPWEFNLRDVIRWGSLMVRGNQRQAAAYLNTVYLQRFRTTKDRNLALRISDAAFFKTPTHTPVPAITLTSSRLELGHLALPRRNFASSKRSGRLLKKHLITLESLGDCISQSWLAIVVGGRNSGKTELIRSMACLTGNDVHEISVNTATDTMDILGSFEQVDVRGQVVEILDEVSQLVRDVFRTSAGSRVLAMAQTLVRELQSIRASTDTADQLRRTEAFLSYLMANEDLMGPGFAVLHLRATALLTNEATGRFEWVDGPLVKALKNGNWILLDGANLCSPSVLDRLNSLCENDGRLVLSERGFVNGHVEVIQPHKDFRLFMTVDPYFGELSRAMRNRGIEVTLTEDDAEGDLAALQDYVRLPSLPELSKTDTSASLAEFDAIRRGMSREVGTCTHSFSSLGVIQCSARSPALLNQIASLSFAAPFSQEASIPFIVRTSVPTLLPLIKRHGAANQFYPSSPSMDKVLQLLSDPGFQEGMNKFHNIVNTGLSYESRVAKPFDVYMVSNGPVAGMKDGELSAPHAALLNYLDLIASRFISGVHGREIPMEELTEKHASIIRAVRSVATAIQEVVSIISQEYLNDPYAHSGDARNACLLLSCAVQLEEVANAIPFDFSRGHAIARWFSDILPNSSALFSGVSRALDDLKQLISPARGFGLTEVWESFYVKIPNQVTLDLQNFSHLSQCLKDKVKIQAVRRQILDTVSVALSHPEMVSSGKYAEMTSKLNSYFSVSTESKCLEASPTVQPHDPSCLGLELSILSGTNSKKAARKLQKFVHSACGDENVPLGHLVPYQSLTWSIEEEMSHVKGTVLASISWFEATWKLRDSRSVPASIGPGFLNRPIYLVGAMEACTPTSTPLSHLAAYTTQLGLQMERVYAECDDQRPRSEMLRSFFFKNLDLISSCFTGSQEAGEEAGLDATLADRVQLFLHSTNAHFKDAVIAYIEPLCREDKPHESGLGWIGLSRMLLTLTVPNIPIDPASIRNSDYNRLTREQERVDAQLSLHRHLEILLTGHADNEVLRHLRLQLESIHRQLEVTPQLPERHDISQLHQFWNEVGQFLEMVLNPAKIETLINKVRSGDSQFRLEEEVLQESLSSFYQRLDSLYHDFSDLVVISKLAIQYFRLGLRLFVSHSSQALFPQGSHQNLISAVVAYPKVASVDRVLGLVKSLDILGGNAFQGILMGAAAISTRIRSGAEAGIWVPVLDELYQQARGMWNIDRAKERDAVAASSTLYRKSNLDYSAMTDAEIEEHEFLALFPNFEDVMEEQAGPQGTKPVSSLMATQDQVSILCDLHMSLMSSVQETRVADVTFQDLRKQTLQTLLDLPADSLTATLDHDSLPFRLSLLHGKIASLETSGDSNLRPNFYLDSNVPEVRKVVPILTRLLEQLEALQIEWPDQEVLRHLGDLVKKVLEIDGHSPIAKILSAIEQLLLRTEDWEMYANRDNSLRIHREALTTLIVDWRRLELSCWNALLEAETKECRRTGAKWWFQLYDSSIRGVLIAAAEEDDGQGEKITVYLRDLVSILTDFMTSSTLGEFVYRLDLLDSFSAYSFAMASTKQGKESDALKRVGILLSSTRQYFQQFSGKSAARLASERAVLEKEIKNFIKLASWKDINVLALKASAQRSHHQLYKIVRKFRETLRTPVSSQLVPEFVSNPQQISVDCPPTVDPNVQAIPPPSDLTSPIDHVAKLHRTFVKFESLIHNKIRPTISKLSSDRAEELATEIISTCHRLASISVPSALRAKDLGEKRAKFLKSVQSQKRKAWADWLKEMKHAGISHRLKPELLSQNIDPLWIKEQPILHKGDDQVLLDKLEGYFFKLQVCLATLRASSSAHHDDISSRDLGKGVAVVESIFNTGVALRASLAGSSTINKDLIKTLCRMKEFNLSAVLFYEEDLPVYLSQSRAFFFQASEMLAELTSAIRTFHLAKTASLSTTVDHLDKMKAESDNFRNEIMCIERSVDSSKFLALQKEEVDALQRCTAFAKSLGEDLRLSVERYPQLAHLFVPSYDWVSVAAADLPPLPSPSNSTSGDVLQSFEALVNTLLITMQSASSYCDQQIEATREPEDDERYLSRLIDSVRRSNQVLNISTVHSQLEDMLRIIRDSSVAMEYLPRILPFLEAYLRLSQDQLIMQTHWVKSLFKLDYVLCSVVQTVATQGFCKIPDENEDGGNDTTETSSGGVGLGEGSGQENVSKEIEDESQVEGLKGEDEDEKPREKDQNEKEDALEMTEDFGGDLEDVPDEGSDEEEGSDSDEGSDVDPEERMEELDPLDPNAVDEKLWGDEDKEEGPDEKDNNDQTNQDNAKTQDGKSEVVAKEGNDRESGKEKENEPAPSEETGEHDEGKEQEEQKEQEEEAEMEDNPEPNASGAPMDEHIPEGDVLDLPDDMDLGEEENREDAQMEDLEDDLNDMGDEEMPDAEDLEGDDEAVDENHAEGKDGAPEDDGATIEEEQPDLTAETEAGVDNDEESGENEITGKEDISNGADGVDAEDMGEGGAEESTESGQAGASRRGGDRGAESEDKAINDQGPAENQDQEDDPAKTESETKGAAAADGQEGDKSTETEYKETPNPLRSLGDALKEIQQRFDEILDQDADTPQVKPGDVDSKDEQLEYLRPDDEDVEMQALGPAEKQDAAKLNELKMADGDEDNTNDAPMDLDHEMAEAPAEQNTFEPPSSLDQKTSHSQNPDLEGAIMQQTSNQTGLLDAHPSEDAPKAEAEQEEFDHAVEAQLRNWRASDYTSEGAERLWRLYESLTHDLAYALCEQLRLILEPTLATRLKGDYRTGKRLNMKKVISYIASDYTKDKIWLRRTKPSQREYQVLIAIDDSRSMAESHSIHLAYETLALLGKALNRLESGDISVVKFGEAVDVVHGFDDGPLTDQAGSKVIDAFRFNQKATNVLSLLETSLSVLDRARERRSAGSSSASDLWQLEIIISDGMCQDHEKLRTMLRRAEEKRIMVVFIILDSLHTAPKANDDPSADDGKRSILHMDKAEFKNVDGRMELQLQKYLDSFPFEYYVVLRDVEALPDVLSSTLKQFFERISEQ